MLVNGSEVLRQATGTVVLLGVRVGGNASL